MRKFVFEDFSVTHQINKKLKHSYISIKNEEVLLKTPNVSDSFVHTLLESKKRWISKQLEKARVNKPLEINLEDEVLLFGAIYSIDSDEATLLRKQLEKLRITSSEKITKAYNLFYKAYAQDYITQRVEHFSKIMAYSYKEIKYRKMKSRWGSCSSTKILTFNTELMKVRKELIDYVVVHELAHLKHMNHSREFHMLVDSYLPDSKAYRKALRDTKIVY